MFADLNRAFIAEQRDPHRSPEHPLAARAADQILSDLGMRYPSLPYHFRIDSPTLAALEDATRALANAEHKVLAYLCAKLTADEMVAMFEVPPDMARYIDWPTVPSSGMRMLRADIIPTDSGYWFCEINHFSGVGAGEAYHSARTFAELLGRPVAGISPFRQLALLYVTECRRAHLARVVVLDTVEHRRQGFGEHLMMQRYVRLLAPDIELAYHDEETYPKRWLEPDEARRTLVHRLFTFDDTTDRGEFLAAVRDSGATVSCMFEAELMMHRLWLALLCDPAYHHLFDDDELAAIEQHVPHTAVVRPDDIDAVVADKDALVFKRSYSYGGQGILIGDQYDPARLRDLLTRDGITWVAQRRVHAATLDLPRAEGGPAASHLALGMYCYGDRTSGLLVRGNPVSPVVNLSRGARVSWAFGQ
jgi:hypothetical protein